MYDPKPSKDYCEQVGMVFSEDDFNEFAAQALTHDLTQEQVDFAMRQHAWRIKHLFNPKTYNYISRIKIALYFVNPFVKDI